MGVANSININGISNCVPLNFANVLDMNIVELLFVTRL